jgi:ferrous-iron efflux pump FieF
MRQATYASVTVAVTLIAAKWVIWEMSDSVALLSSLIDSSLDVMASLISLFAIRQALMPPDKEHRFGHGKAESLAALGQSLFVGGSAVFLVFEAGGRVLRPQEIDHGIAAISVMVLSLILTFVLVQFQRFVIKETGSMAIAADSLHYSADLLVNGGIIIGLIAVTALGWTLADPLIALAVAFYLIVTAWRIALRAMDMLMDRELDDDARAEIRSIILSHPAVKSMHDLRTRSAGVNSFIQFHLELDGDLSLSDAHQISDEVEKLISAKFENAEILIHEDPEGLDEDRPSFA